jgi:hypothetical protein
MPPNSTQNLNAKLSLTADSSQRQGTSDPSAAPQPIHSGPPVRIVGGAARYQGGYHLAGL